MERIKDPFLDKRCKLIPCQIEMMKYWYERGMRIVDIRKMFKVSNTRVRHILFPEEEQRNRILYSTAGTPQQNRERSLRCYYRTKNLLNETRS